MTRWLAAIASAVLLSGQAGPSAGQTGLTDDEARRLIEQYKSLSAQTAIQQTQIQDLRRDLNQALRENGRLREELVKRGIDVEALLGPATTQPDQALRVFLFDSPEALVEYLRKNFTDRVRPDMTQLQRESAQAEFDSWLSSTTVLPSQVAWVVQVVDVWRAASPQDVVLHYSNDRDPLEPLLGSLTRSLDEVEMMELTVARLRAERQRRQELHARRVEEQSKAPATHKQLAQEAMRQAYDRLVDINVQLRQAEGRYAQFKSRGGQDRASTQPDHDEFRILIHARGARDHTVELTVFAQQQDAARLLAAPKGSLVKLRGWLTDAALGPQLQTMGLRLDRTQVLAVNVEPPVPPPAVPDAPSPPPAGAPEPDPQSGKEPAKEPAKDD